MRHNYTASEILSEIKALKHTFQSVRLVDPSHQAVYDFTKMNTELKLYEHSCFSIWLKNSDCLNCISAKALLNKTIYTKFEFIEDDIFYIISKYVKVDDIELVMEIVTQINEGIQIDGDGYNNFIDRITKYNSNIYSDELTGTYNRRYLNEKLPQQIRESLHRNINIAIAIIDLDSFKEINDRFGHPTGDKVLGMVAHYLRSNVSCRKNDYTIRYGGDEFILVFHNIEMGIFRERLNEIVRNINILEIATELNINLSASAGGVCLNEVENPTMSKLIAAADQRLYAAKHNGRNQAVSSGSSNSIA